jgi:hypothetical protein
MLSSKAKRSNWYHKITEEYTLRTALFIKAEQQDQFDFEIAKKEEVKEKKMQNNKAITLIWFGTP